MKTFFLTSVSILFCITSFSQDINALDDKYGFREAKFEMPFDSFKNLVEVEPNFYILNGENLRWGNYVLGGVYYYFYKGLLSAVVIKTNGYINSTGILKILQDAYGKGFESNANSVQWFGDKVIMTYKKDSNTDNTTVYIHCKKLYLLENPYKK